MNSPKQLYESLFILYKCQLNIDRLHTLILENRNQEADENDAILLAQYLLMEGLSFIVEFKENMYKVAESEYKTRVQEIQKITKPIFDRINKWKDLGKYRNNIIAHPWRDSGKFAIPNDPSYNVPRNWVEIFILAHLLKYVWSMVQAEFMMEIGEAIIYIDKTYPFNLIMHDSYSDLNEDHVRMARKVDQIRKEFKKPYFLKVEQFIFDD
jgi:hypothetical protein